MYQVKRSAIVAHSAAKMYQLVADIPAYPDFMPWADSAKIDSHVEQTVIATIGVNFKGIRQSFTTKNQHEENARIDMALVSGPFSHLQGHWQFTPMGDDRCEITLLMDFSFKNRFLSKILGQVFSLIGDSMVQAFEKRANEMYKKIND